MTNFDEIHEIDDSNISLSIEIKCQSYNMLQSLFDETNKVILIKEKLVAELNA
jgi:hypothetical protein